MGGAILRVTRKAILWLLFLAFIAVCAVLGAYFLGYRLPVHTDVAPIVFQNWNKTREVNADIVHGTGLIRREGRLNVEVDLQIPEASERLKAFMDGGRTEIVVCGEQGLFMHSLRDGTLDIEDDLIKVAGHVDLELAGLIDLRDTYPIATAIRVGHDRTNIWADVISLDIDGIPDPMVEVILDNISRFSYTREQILDMVAASLEPEDAAYLVKHRDALDLAFEEVRPVRDGDVIHLDTLISVDEKGVLGAISDRLATTARDRANRIAEALGPAKTHAQLPSLKDLEDAGNQLGDAVGGAAKDVTEADPIGAIADTLDGLTDCRTTF